MSKEKKTKYPDGSAIPRHLQQEPLDKDIYPVSRKGQRKGSKKHFRSLSDEQAMEMGFLKRVKEGIKNKREPVREESGMRRFYKGGKV